jgi:CheY-like chemotaxis protein
VYGQGTTFHVTIPKVLGDEKLIRPTDGHTDLISAPEAKVLVVDDNTINLNVACGLLGLCKITADTAMSGRQAIEMIHEKNYDIVFMDHMMPETDGAETTRIIREMGINVPVIALSANVVMGAKEEFLAAGMNDLLAKPIKKALLNKVLADWLPAEKLKYAEEETIIAPETETGLRGEFWNQIEKIKGLSVQAGLGSTSDQLDIYERSLNLTIREIEKCERNLINFLTAEDMRNFAIEVHSMKGTLANIGATELSTLAQKLENAAGGADSAFCTSNLPSFLEALGALKTNLTKAFVTTNQDNGQFKIPPEILPVFENLTAALDKMDFPAIDEAMKILNVLNPGGPLKEEIDQIKYAVLMMDYDTAREIINNSELILQS